MSVEVLPIVMSVEPDCVEDKAVDHQVPGEIMENDLGQKEQKSLSEVQVEREDEDTAKDMESQDETEEEDMDVEDDNKENQEENNNTNKQVMDVEKVDGKITVENKTEESQCQEDVQTDGKIITEISQTAIKSYLVSVDSLDSQSSSNGTSGSSQEPDTEPESSESQISQIPSSIASEAAFQFVHKEECEFKREDFEERLGFLCPLEYLKGQMAAMKTAAIKSKRKGRKICITEMIMDVEMHPAVEVYLTEQRKLMGGMRGNFLSQCECFSPENKAQYLKSLSKAGGAAVGSSSRSPKVDDEPFSLAVESAGTVKEDGSAVSIPAQMAYRSHIQNLLDSDLDVSTSSSSDSE